eukprot:TRINITY_DN1233_c0_g1_i1.p1 TRINITY_DN1233_c0_g1~~TRINITY_DN1233_c0_g1_i1.p1  ORF type:complete len:4262 (-),score=887.85 TRINITY_DN1233_c0_g1_i1:333-13118(-)
MAEGRDEKVSEFKEVGGQLRLVPKRSLGASGSLPNLAGTSTSFRQRGIMSEVVKAHRSKEVDNCKQGPEAIGARSGNLGKSASATGGFSLSNKLRSKALEAEPKEPKKLIEKVEPKVIDVYQHLPGDCPRKVTVERRRKWFESLDVERLLAERSCHFQAGWDREFWLQLDDFDSTEFDIRTPEEWIHQGYQPDGNFLPLQAKALRWQDDGSGIWEQCTVERVKNLDDGKGTKHFELRWSSKGTETEAVSRLRIVFYGEDPEVFADRVAFAFAALRKAQLRIGLNFFLDNMPVQDIQVLDDDQVARVLDLSKNSAALREVGDSFCNEVIREVNMDFARTMNKIIFCRDPQVQKPPGHSLDNPEEGTGGPVPSPGQGPGLFDGINIDDLEEEGDNSFERPVPWFSLWPVCPPSQRRVALEEGEEASESEYSFTSTFSSFCFASLYIKPEVVSSLCQVARENISILASCIFKNKFQRIMKPEQFRQTEKLVITSMSQRIREAWVANVQKVIMSNFKNVGKGWFSIHESNQDTYKQSKLKKLLAVVKFMMQDCLEFFALDSVDDYCRGLEELCPEQVVVTDLLNVTSEFAPQCRPRPAKRGGSLELMPPGRPECAFRGNDLEEGEQDLVAGAPVFMLEIKTTEEKTFAYTTSSEAAVDVCAEVFDMGVLSLSDVPQVEPQVVPQLFKTVVVKPVLNTVTLQTDFVKNRKAQLLAQLRKGLPALGEYLALFKPLEELLELDPAEFVQAKLDADVSTEEAKKEILDQKEKENAIYAMIPETVVVGLFEVSCVEVRKVLAGKHKKIQDLLLDMLLTRFRDNSQETCDAFAGIFARLRKAPKDIEEVTSMREFIATIPGEIAKQAPDCKKCMDCYDILESFGVALTADDFFQRWRVFACPKSTWDLVETTEQGISELQEEFARAQREEQSEFDSDIIDMAATIENFAQYSDMTKLNEIYENVESLNEKLKHAVAQSKVFNSRELLFGKDLTDYSMISTLQKEWEPFSQLWVTTYGWITESEKWLTGPFSKVDAKTCESFVQAGTKTLFKAVRALEKRENCDAILGIAKDMKTQMDDFVPKVPLVVGMRNPGMAARHWTQISELVGHEIKPDMENFTLQHFIDLGMVEHSATIGDIGDRAGKEQGIENQLKAMKAAWEKVYFDCSEPYRTTETYILKGAEEAMVILDEQIVVVQAMQFSPFNKPFKDDIDEWNDKLVYISECLDQWLKVQRAWMYLQPIFDSPDIMKQLPTEGKKFKSVDQKWRKQMNKVHNNGHVLTATTEEGLLVIWQTCNNDLDMVQKGLDDYLETKRGAFARFYFLSNDELLEILSQTKDPLRVQPFLSKVFEAMKSLTFTDALVATQMHSKEGEIIDFVTPVVTKDKNVEVWMTDAENEMMMGVREAMKNGIESYPETARTQWVLDHAGQVVLNGSQVHWTAEVEEAIKAADPATYFRKCQEQLLDLVRLVRGKMTKLQRMSIGALIVIDVHARDTVEGLARDNIDDCMSFEWISQLRYYWVLDDRNTDNLWVRMVQTPFPYGYEYLGNSFRLVITPLTDMCYMTLMGAQSLNLGGAPAGPAGTGKTETTKDLAKALAKQCVVFNCSPEMDYIMVGKFFKGLASSGAWCCFDEFNRIYIEVLSVIAQQLLQLFSAKRELASYNDTCELEFDSTMIVMKPTFNVFITMNPGYAGRSELPDNLAALFRPMAMMVPDYGMIGEISFYSFGFENGKHLAKKMVTTFQLCSEQLSAQSHYDYGMRAVKTVIEAAGLNKRKYPDQEEAQILLRALQDVNAPKFLKDDLPLFYNIMTDLFPGVEKPVMDYGALTETIEEQARKRLWQPTTYFVQKQFELFDMIQVRHGMMLVGPTGGGKTCILRNLQASCSALMNPKDPDSPYQKVHIHTLNPKAITQNQLYGAFDEVTREWADGVAAELIRNATRDNHNPDHHWIMFDGPVDALWIESMNTVLDDNKKLCLVSGEIIALTAKMRMQFEVEDLEVASPATVSRCGMIYSEPESLGYGPFFDSWLQTLPETFSFKPMLQETLKKYLYDMVDPSIIFIKKNTKKCCEAVDNSLLQNLFKMMDCYFVKYRPDEIKLPATFKDAINELSQMISPLYYFCTIWSIGATADASSRPGFSKYLWASLDATIRAEVEPDMEKLFIPMLPMQEGVTMPGIEVGDLLYDYFFDMEQKMFVPWMTTIPKYEVPRAAKYEEIVVPSLDSVRLVYVFQLLVLNDKHVLCPGPTGTGKSVNISLWLQKQAPDNYQGVFINFSAQTHVNQLQDLIDSKLEKRRRGVYGPPAGKKMVLFIDDLNMPLKEYYGAQPPIELIRQWHDHGGWFNRKELVKFDIIDVVMVSAMGPPGGGKTFITERLKRHYTMLSYSDFSVESITQMFTVITSYFFSFFDESVRNLIPSAITSTIAVFKQALADLLPTPSKSHYLFNLRDIWKVFLGMCSLSSKKSNNPQTVARCWSHECQRIFGDRLTDKTDLAWMKTQTDTAITERFGLTLEEVYTAERLVFGSFLTQEIDNRTYDEIPDMKAMKTSIEEYLDDYNQVFSINMPLVMFLDACEHCARICRVLCQPSGHVLLLGVGGSGRQSLTRLSAYMNEGECFQIEVAKGYGMTEFKDDLKRCLMKCGVEDKVQIFLFCDTQIVKEDFVEAINNVLNSGDVPNLYANEDFDAISNACRALCQSLGMQPTKANLFSAYLTRVKKNVHVTLAFSPVGDSFRNRLRMFPSLVNCCTIDWFHEWPAEALYSVAKQQIMGQSVELPNLEGSLTMFQTIHQSVESASKRFLASTGRNVYITPTSYLELLASFMKTLADKRKEVGTLQHRYSVGLGKIGDAEEQVAGLQQMLVDKKPALVQTQKEVGEMMVVIEKDSADAQVVQAAVEKEEAAASVKAAETQAIKEDAQRDLDEALPALDQAVECLRKLKKEHIQEVKALANPPGGVRLACEAVCIMFQHKPQKVADPNNPAKKIDDYWPVAKGTVLADPKKLLDDLMNFDKDNIPDKVISSITAYIEREDFDPAAIKKASIACEALCLWVRAMYTYHFVAKAVEPKRKMLAEAEADLAECQEKLEAAQTKLREVQNKLAKLQADLDGANAKMKELADDMNLCEVKLVRAHKLIGGLGGEKARWGQNVKDLTAKLDLLPGDCIVAAGMVSYVGPFTSQVRTECEELWRESLDQLEIVHSPGCNMYSVLGDPVKIQQWVVCALPNDTLSIENGIIIDRSRRWPLCIDPQRQANKYIKNMGKDTETGIDVCKLSEKNFLRTLELGIQFGKWILLENIGINLDPALEPVLGQQKVKDGSGYVIKLGDKTVDYNDTFKFFMTTTLPNPHYSPETSVKVTLLNFAITPVGLEDQMLGILVAKERPDMEEEKNQLIVQNARNNKILKELEDEILRLLATSEGDVLEDDTLVDKVTESKAVSDDIASKREVAVVTEAKIDAARESYRPVAYRASVLFFCIVELTNIDPMYQYSLQWFQKLFTISIDNSKKTDDLEERLEILKNFFTEALYQSICRGLFEKDKTLFSFALCCRVLKGDNQLDDQELRYLLVGPTADLVEKGPPIPDDWVGAPRWNEILTLATLPAFPDFDNVFVKELVAMRRIYDSIEADKEELPEPWQSNLTSMQKLCFIRAIRIDCLTAAVITFITDKIGQQFVEPPTFDIAKSFGDSANTTPLVFILSPGTDPVADVIAYADKLGMGKRFESISLGQGQGPKATKMIENAQSSGGWVLLSNCHLMESWMSSLEAIVEQLNPEEMQASFRLWLTSMPAKTFPVQVLQNSVKMTNEPPSGLRANVYKSYVNFSDDLFKESNKPEIFKTLLFGFCFFHAVVQDRRKFGPIGWNIQYRFTPEDIQVCRQQLMLFVNQYDLVPYKVLNFLGSAINYGGRVTDDKDKLLIKVILQTYICKEAVDLKEGYKFSDSGLYYAPSYENIEEAITYIKGLPLFPMPEAFGLHENCNITVAQDEALALLTGMQSMVSLGGGGGGGGSADDVMDQTAASIQERLPTPFPLDQSEARFPTMYEESMNTVVKQEHLRYNKLLWAMAASLKDFRKAIKGLIVMTGELEAAGKSLFVNEVPEMWSKKGPLSLKPLSSWYLDILARCAFFQMWFDIAKPPPCFWVSGIFFPQAFFTGAIQNFARKYTEEIDLLSYKQVPLPRVKDAPKEILEPPEDGVIIYGLFLEGARYDSVTEQLENSRPKELFTDMPVLHFVPVKNRVPDVKDYRMPCYKVISRKGTLLTTGHSTNFVLYIETKTDKPVEKWIKAGVASFLALKY